MPKSYVGVRTRFLRDDERLMTSAEKEMPLVIEPENSSDIQFLQQFLNQNAKQILDDIAHYGAVLLRGFDVKTDEDFENTVLSVKGMRGISEALMSEHGRTHVAGLNYVLHTNSVYKTGGTLYLGGFHSENYYNPDVPTYISFCCLRPSALGGETGLVNMEKVYAHIEDDLKQRLEEKNFFVSKWLVSEVVNRYNVDEKTIEAMCKKFDLPIIGQGDERFILMYKPSVWRHPETNQSALQINFYDLPRLNVELRKQFMDDYKGKDWFWHRCAWRMPTWFFGIMEVIYMSIAAFINSPKQAIKLFQSKYNDYQAANKNEIPKFNDLKVDSCFSNQNIKDLAKLVRTYYCSCLWQAGDIILVDNRKVMHAGMPGAGDRLIRAMICNPMELSYSYVNNGKLDCKERAETIGCYMTNIASLGQAQLDPQEI